MGVYITLVSSMYEMAGPVERDDERLYRICGCRSKRTFVRILDFLIAEGKVKETENGLINDKVTKEIKKIVEKSSSARTAAEARWSRKPNKNNAGSNANAMRTHMRTQCQPKPKPEPYRKTIQKDFDRFWEIYPSKKGKKPALEKFKLAVKNGRDPEEIIQGAQKYLGFKTVREGFIANPTTWLNQERWNDEESPKANGTASKADMYRSMK